MNNFRKLSKICWNCSSVDDSATQSVKSAYYAARHLSYSSNIFDYYILNVVDCAAFIDDDFGYKEISCKLIDIIKSLDKNK